MKSKIYQATNSDGNVRPLNAWNAFFKPTSDVPSEELIQLVSRLIALSNEKGPHYQSLDRAEKFFKDIENATKLNDVFNEKNESKRKKKIEETPDIP